jgi:hypothetical protein
MFNWNLIYNTDALEWPKTNAPIGKIGGAKLYIIFSTQEFFFATELKFLLCIVDILPTIPMSLAKFPLHNHQL